MRAASPDDVFILAAVMRPTLEDIAAFTADYLAGEAVAVQVFAAAFDNTFLFAMLANHITGCRKNLPGDDQSVHTDLSRRNSHAG